MSKTDKASNMAKNITQIINSSTNNIDDNDMLLNTMKQKVDKLANFWDSEEAKRKPWLEEVPPYITYEEGDNFRDFIEARITELLYEIDYKVWQQKDYSYWYKWKFQEFYVYTENQNFSKDEVSIDVFKETDHEIKSLLIECLCLYKQLWKTTQDYKTLAIWADLKTINNEDMKTLCKITPISNSMIALDKEDTVTQLEGFKDCIDALKSALVSTNKKG